jgi:hypothetical protein
MIVISNNSVKNQASTSGDYPDFAGKTIFRIEHASSARTNFLKHLGITPKPEFPFSICQPVP